MRPVQALPTGTVTFLFTDIEGSTRLLRALGERYPAVLAEHHRLLAEAVAASGGVDVGTEGDALFAAFPSAPRAVGAAAAAQRALAAGPWPEGAEVRVRMGLHTGEGQLSDGTYVGLDVHRAARVAAVAHGGQTLLSAATRALAEQALPAGAVLRDLGEHRLKDLAQPERLYQLVLDDLPSEFPPLRTLDATPNNLPTQLTSFIGRQHELTDAIRLLHASRLLTLTGPGGTGKTRLALQLAADVSADYPDGVFFVPLAPIGDAGLVVTAISQALGLRDSGPLPPIERLTEHLRDRRVLLLLDNFEQVLAAAPLVADLLRGTPTLRIVVSSRAALHVSGEQELPVPPLGLPDPARPPQASALSQYEAVALFIERAVAVKPDFQVTNDNAPAVAEICARLDGLPLAIELAAARVKLLPPAALLARLGKRLDMPGTLARDLPARQQTLRGAIAWSHDLLDAEAQRLFARFSIFVGGAGLEAAETVCGDDVASDVLDRLAELVDQSLLRQSEADGEPRFSMLATIREFALERLAASGELPAIAERHAQVFLDLAEEAAPKLTGRDARAWLDRLAQENGNLRAAIGWAIETGATSTGLRLGFALWRFWQMRGLLTEGAGWLDRLLALPLAGEASVARARALEAAGSVAYWRGRMPEALAYYEESLAICRALGDRNLIANALYNVSFPTVVDKSNVGRALPVLEESLAIYRELGDREMVARVLWGLANAHYFGGDYESARDTLLEDVEMFRQAGDAFGLAWALHTLGLAYNRLGLAASHSAPRWREALEHFARVHDVSGIILLLGDFSLLAVAQGDAPRAVRLASAADHLASSRGTELALVASAEESWFADPSGLDPAMVEAESAAGRAMSIDEAVVYALDAPELSPVAPSVAT